MKMTRTEALQKSLAMWKWIAEEPFRDKGDYHLTISETILEEGDDFYTYTEDYPRHGCYICQFHMVKDGLVTTCPGDCPINWGSNEPFACEVAVFSPYKIWCNDHGEYTDEEVQDAANRIVKLHEEALDDF